MASINCFQECLKSNKDESLSEHSFKLNKQKRFITLAKNVTPSFGNQGNLMTHSSVMTESRKIQEGKLKKIVAKSPCKNQFKETRPQQRIIEKQSVIMQPVQLIVCRPQSNLLAFNPRQCKSIEKSQRKYSLDTKNKPGDMHCRITFTYNQQNKRPKSQQKQICYVKVLHSKPMQIQQKTIKPTVMNPIKEEPQQKQKCSSLFQGAKSIVSRLVTSRKREYNDTIIKKLIVQSPVKKQKQEIQKFYASARLCQTQNNLIVTHSSIASVQQDKKSSHTNGLSLQKIPMSPHTKTMASYQHFKIGKLLGIGKWAHAYLCQQNATHSIYAIKEIFKQSFKTVCSVERFNREINRLMGLQSCSLVNIYSKLESVDKFCLLLEYCNRSGFEQIQGKGLLSIELVRKYSESLVKGLIYLHQNDIIHGNVNIFQVFSLFGQCKLKHSLAAITTEAAINSNSYKHDIQGLGIVIFELGNGLVPSITAGTLYEREKQYLEKESRKKTIQYIRSRVNLLQIDDNYQQLNNFVALLLDWDPECRLTGNVCLSHPFFQKTESN